jgi:UDP-N-acetylmuramate--alanine ligase
VAVAGTHGKTTTTAMATDALAAAGREPTGLAGGRIPLWQGNVRPGRRDLHVVEADEYDRAFLALTPQVAVVTNVEPEHLDVYGDVAAVRAAFEQFLQPARYVIFCADDPGARSLALPAGAVALSYGVQSAEARLTVSDLMSIHGRPRGMVQLDGVELGELALRVPGVHNMNNALAALGCGLVLGAEFEELRPGLEAFEGVERRFQLLGTVRGIDVVDDYAHHPTEIRATLDAARAVFPGRRLVCAFQPHLFSRTRDFAPEFGRALARADAVLLTEIYPAREAPIPGVSAALIEGALQELGRRPLWRGPREDLVQALGTVLQEGDVVLTLGAGDITLAGRELLQRLAIHG